MSTLLSTTYDTFADEGLSFQEIPFNGKFGTIEKTISLVSIESAKPEFENYIKNELAKDIANYMIKNQLISFTKQENIVENTVTYRARFCLMPTDQVQILRKSL